MSNDPLLPSGLTPDQVQARIGLISDTHMPQRRRHLPPALFDLFQGVDLILHAGDMGELWVLDQLSALAPVVAVHGNDDSPDAQRELPYQQIITVAGMRILLWHSHYPDWDEEMASRAADEIHPNRTVERARRAQAWLAVFGHWHIPLTYRHDGILVVNPGALASGNELTRQLRHTVALLYVDRQATPHIVHVDLAAPDRPYTAVIDWQAGFSANYIHYSASILTPELASAMAYLRARLTRDEIMAMRETIAELAHPVWEEQRGYLTLTEVEEALLAANLSGTLKRRLTSLMADWRAAQA